MLKRTIETVEHLKYPVIHWKALDEIDAGVCEGMTYEEIKQKMPEDFKQRERDKFGYRYPRGEVFLLIFHVYIFLVI